MRGVAVEQLMNTIPVYPLTEVRVIGIDPEPLEGRVIFFAEMVKLGRPPSADALAQPKLNAITDSRQIDALFGFIPEPPLVATCSRNRAAGRVLVTFPELVVHTTDYQLRRVRMACTAIRTA